ncbi:MAG: DUF429 domain-containing protein [Microscillaceae bacterium]|nr:DUF429 domain-containing protein [Microscillaceae bacterium]MDW8461003.1 DUF429 domain-containing protein [Cytophagales bacterium]
MLLVGIDFGSKLAGTTVLACLDLPKREIFWEKAKKKQDADAFLIQRIQTLQPALIALDAPLSLPRVYAEPTAEPKDFFFRKGDRDLRAMSPMFLGGLTARAMQLKSIWQAQNIPIIEAYPAAQAQRLHLAQWNYKKHTTEMAKIQAIILRDFSIELATNPLQATTWHEIDALLALLTAYRVSQDLHQVFGEETEGQIFV